MAKSRSEIPYASLKDGSLGSIEFSPGEFPKELFARIEKAGLKKKSIIDRHEIINRALFEQIKEEPKGAFLLPKMVKYVTRMREYLPTYTLSSFEFFLRHYTESTDTERSVIRGKIVGKCIPRAEYQLFFPIGAGAVFEGSHFSIAHYSPDLDTTVASFLFWLCAFGAEIGNSLTYWVVPTGAPKESVEIDHVFKQALGDEVFSVLTSTSKKISISSRDLLTQDGVIYKKLNELSYDTDSGRTNRAVILVDDEGRYLGDWRQIDVEAVRGVISRFVGMLLDHRNFFQTGLVSIFAEKNLTRTELETFINSNLKRPLNECQTAREFTEEQRNVIDRFIRKVLLIKSGFGCTYSDLLDIEAGSFGLGQYRQALLDLSKTDLFSTNGEVIEDRGVIFKEIETVLGMQQEVFGEFTHYLDTLEVALKIKTNVFGLEANYLTHLAESEEIISQMGDYSYMTVNYEDQGHLYPLGVVRASQVKKEFLGTSSWCDFSNCLETDCRDDLMLISVFDHHKMELKTRIPATGVIRDAQSSNSMIGRFTMQLNEQYSTAGRTLDSVEKQLAELYQKAELPSELRILQRLLQKKNILTHPTPHRIASDREILEYMQFLYAILDDTDTLTKVTEYDLLCVRDLLNRLKTLMVGEEVEVVDFDDLDPADRGFVKKAARKLLQCHDLYSIYKRVGVAKEVRLDKIILETLKGRDTPLFQDTKIQAVYASITQLKLYAKNRKTLSKKLDLLRQIWVNRCQKIFDENNEIPVHMFMLTTLSSPEELFADHPDANPTQDEMWFWVPEGNKKAHYLLKEFMEKFLRSKSMKDKSKDFKIFGKKTESKKVFEEILQRPKSLTYSKSDSELVVLSFDQKVVTSRKAHISICL